MFNEILCFEQLSDKQQNRFGNRNTEAEVSVNEEESVEKNSET